MRSRRLWLTLIVVAVFTADCGTEIRFPPGVVAPEAPRQIRLEGAPVFVREDFLLKGIARFEVDARILGRKRYRFGRSADLAPLDLALGWGPMSDQSVIDEIKVTQSRRFYWWRVKKYPIPRRSIVEHSANMHMIPASEAIRKTLLSVRKGQRISFSGYLVNVTSGDGFNWRTSTSRTDSGSGACEIVFVESVSVSEV